MTTGPIEVVVPKGIRYGDVSLSTGQRKAMASQLALEIQQLTSIIEERVGVTSNLRRVRLYNLPPNDRVRGFYVHETRLLKQPSGLRGRFAELAWERWLEQPGEPGKHPVLPANTLWLNANAAIYLLCGLRHVRPTQVEDEFTKPIGRLKSLYTREEFGNLVVRAFENLLHELTHSLQGPLWSETDLGEFVEALIDSTTRAIQASVAHSWGISSLFPNQKPTSASAYGVHNAVLSRLLRELRSQDGLQREDQLFRLIRLDGRETAFVTLAGDLAKSAGLEPDELTLGITGGFILGAFNSAAELEQELGEQEQLFIESKPSDRDVRRMGARNDKIRQDGGRQFGGEAIRRIRSEISTNVQRGQMASPSDVPNSRGIAL